MVIPPDLVDHFMVIRRAMDLGTPTFYQGVLTDFIGEGHFARHLRRMRVPYQERRTVLVESLRKELGSAVDVIGSEAGMHLTVTVPHGTDDVEIGERAARQNLWVWPLSTTYLGQAARPGFILGFGSTDVSDIPHGVEKLHHLLTGR
jgi:GntR family transcriptional regulator / MocR family aminotransferase